MSPEDIRNAQGRKSSDGDKLCVRECLWESICAAWISLYADYGSVGV